MKCSTHISYDLERNKRQKIEVKKLYLKRKNFSHVHMTLWNENPPTLRKRRERKKINNFYVWQKHACLKSILAMCQKKFSTFFSFSSEGENFFLSYFLIFSIIIYFYAFFLSFPPSHEKWMGKENKFFLLLLSFHFFLFFILVLMMKFRCWSLK